MNVSMLYSWFNLMFEGQVSLLFSDMVLSILETREKGNVTNK